MVGLWTALHATERKPARIILIEAQQVGWASRPKRRLRRRQPHARTENGKSRWAVEFDRLEQLGMNNLDGMQADIERYDMKVNWERSGALAVATEQHQVPWLRKAAETGEGVYLDEAATRAEVASRRHTWRSPVDTRYLPSSTRPGWPSNSRGSAPTRAFKS